MKRNLITALVLCCGSALALAGPDGQCTEAQKQDCSKECAKACTESGAKVTQVSDDKSAKACTDGDKKEGCCTDVAQCPLLEPLRKLAGSWDVDMDGDGKPDGSVKYRVIANGSAVVEEEMPGTPHEMITVYTSDGKGLIATHYCGLGNQPRMRAEGGLKDGKISFEFVDGGNIKDRNQMHMDSLVLTLVDRDHAKANWSTYANGKTESHVTFDMKRAKDSGSQEKVAAAQ